jgi:hypothetical protein
MIAALEDKQEGINTLEQHYPYIKIYWCIDSAIAGGYYENNHLHLYK